MQRQIGPFVSGSAEVRTTMEEAEVPDDAEWLVRRGIKLVAIDYLSICTFEDLRACHVTLLEKNVHIVEGLDLSRVAPGLWNLLALPMSVVGSDGAPARVLMSRL